MNDREGVELLQWCLPRLRLRWLGFRKVRRQVYKRIDRRMKELGVMTVSAYRSYLEDHAEEWVVLDALCRIFVSRFYRDKAVFRSLGEQVLPALAQVAMSAGIRQLHIWSIGCASGEEPYTLAILWHARCASRFPALALGVIATDVDPEALSRAERGCYAPGTLKDLPPDLLTGAFAPSGPELCVKPEHRTGVVFLQQDVRITAPPELFHLVLCRNVAFTYFDEALQREVLCRIAGRLLSGGALVIGSTESLPAGTREFEPWLARLHVYRRVGEVHTP